MEIKQNKVGTHTLTIIGNGDMWIELIEALMFEYSDKYDGV